jgi:predicted nucleic acid-binding protein
LSAPKPVRDWADNAPKWVEVLSPKSSLLLKLDLGESEAIPLATELHADVVLIDEQAGRQEALRRGLKIAGRLSVLDEADRRDSSFSITRSLNCERPASACRR